jgi:hypothetical protein
MSDSVFAERPLGLQIICQIAAIAEFHDEKHVRRRLDTFQQRHEIVVL